MDNTNTIASAKKPNGVTKWAMVFGIAIVLNLFFFYAISLVYKAPIMNYDNGQVVASPDNQADCVAVGGQWTENATSGVSDANGFTPLSLNGYCDPNYTKENQYEAASNSYERNVFVVLVVLGAVLLVLGAFMANVILALAFSWGGVFSIIIASIRYWGEAGDVLKLVILAAALVALIWVAVKKFGK